MSVQRPPARAPGRSGSRVAAVLLLVLPAVALLGWVAFRTVDLARPDPPRATVSADVTLRPESGGTQVTVDLRTLTGALPDRIALNLFLCDCAGQVAGQVTTTGRTFGIRVQDAAGRPVETGPPSASLAFTLPRQDAHRARFGYWMPLVQGRRVLLPQPWTVGDALAVGRVTVTGIPADRLACQDLVSTFAHRCTVGADGVVAPDGDRPLGPVRLEQTR